MIWTRKSFFDTGYQTLNYDESMGARVRVLPLSKATERKLGYRHVSLSRLSEMFCMASALEGGLWMSLPGTSTTMT